MRNVCFMPEEMIRQYNKNGMKINFDLTIIDCDQLDRKILMINA